MEKKVSLKLFKAMLKKKIKIKKTRTSDLYERRRKNKQSYTTKDEEEDEEEFEKDEMIKVTFYKNNKDDKKGTKQIQNKEILEEDDKEDNNDNNDNLNYEKNKDNIVTKKFIDAAVRVIINDEKEKKDKNNVIKDKKSLFWNKNDNIINKENDNNINKQRENLEIEKIDEDKIIEISSKNDNINNIVEEISKNNQE